LAAPHRLPGAANLGRSAYGKPMMMSELNAMLKGPNTPKIAGAFTLFIESAEHCSYSILPIDDNFLIERVFPFMLG